MSWRIRRQFVVVLVVLTPFVLIGYFLVLKLLPTPTCFDNRKNQEERGIDCGGPCIPCELRNPEQLEIFWVHLVPVRKNIYDVAVFLRNPNEVLSSSDLEYEFSLFDEVGLVTIKTGHTFILPQEQVHIIEANIKTNRPVNKVEFRVLKMGWQLRSKERFNLVTERLDYKVVEEKNRKQGLVEANIFNQTPFSFREVEINFVVLDKDSNLLGVNRIVVENFLSGSKRLIKAVWPEELKGQPSTIWAEPRVNVFDPAIILKPQ